MDILNFISWIRGKRIVTSVDPAKTLIPVGLKDNRRDDGYLAGAITVEDLANQIAPQSTYKVYTALLTQTGTNPPVATVLENTLGLNPIFSYDTAGQYTLTDLSGLFLSNKTAVFMQFKNGGPAMEIYVDNVNQIIIGADGQNDVLLNTFIEIRIYN